MPEGQPSRRGRNGPRAQAGASGAGWNDYNGGSWADESSWAKNSWETDEGWSRGNGSGAQSNRSGKHIDGSEDPYGGGRNGSYRDSGANSGKNGSYRAGASSGKSAGYADESSHWGGSDRRNPFGAAGPAAGTASDRPSPGPFGAAWGAAGGGSGAFGGATSGGGMTDKPKYVPPQLRGAGASDDRASGFGGKGHDSYADADKGKRGGKGYDSYADADNGKRGGKGRDSYADADNGKRGGKGHDSYADADKGKRGGKGHDSYADADNGKRGGKADRGGYDRDTGGKAQRGGKADSDRGAHADAGGKAQRGGKEAGGRGGKSAGSQPSGDHRNEIGKSGGARGRGKGNGGKAETWQDEDEWEEPVRAPEARAKAKSRSGGSGAVTNTYLSDQLFSSLPVSNETKRAMSEGFGYESMTQVQAAAIGPMLDGFDVVARARTGTGKTLAFIIPIVEHLRSRSKYGSISALVLSPTRELAQQITDETKVFQDYHRNLGVACFYGGTNIKADHRHLASEACDLLVATPGRLQDHLNNTPGFSKRIDGLSFLALDEADQLLETGFRDAILQILEWLPPPGRRQGALFSATFPAAVNEIAKLALKANHSWLDTVTDEVTPDQIAQDVAVTDIEGMTEMLWSALSHEIAREPKSYKIMVFFVAARVTQLYSEMFNEAGMKVHEIHSRKSQGHRTKAADTFRSEKRGIVFSSDVLARGMDFPDVTAVVQVGVPSSRDQYIHRLGRTGRAGKSGGCHLLVHDFESYFLRGISDLPVQRLDKNYPFAKATQAPDALWRSPDPKTACQAYQAWLGYYNSAKGLGWKKDHLVAQATRFAESICALTNEGLPPPIMKKVVGKMGLKGVAGLNLVTTLSYGDD